jgi:hypothetical protein
MKLIVDMDAIAVGEVNGAVYAETEAAEVPEANPSADTSMGIASKLVDPQFTYQPVLTIPQHLVQSLNSAGTFESYAQKHQSAEREVGELELIESDDLKLTVELSGGGQLLIPTNSRLLLGRNGDLAVELLIREAE